jgi:hypothetical protein
VVFHHKVTPGELLGGNHTPAFAIDEVNLLGGDRLLVHKGDSCH